MGNGFGTAITDSYIVVAVMQYLRTKTSMVNLVSGQTTAQTAGQEWIVILMYDELIKRLREIHPDEFGDKWDFAFACQRIMQEAADTLGYDVIDIVIFHIEKLILDRRASAIDNKNDHNNGIRFYKFSNNSLFSHEQGL